jgi:hypothetical protein
VRINPLYARLAALQFASDESRPLDAAVVEG